MNNYRYTLEPYKGMKTRHTCPSCGRKKVFTRYIDTETKEYLDDHVGRCSREVKCGYHYTPKQYLQDNQPTWNPPAWFPQFKVLKTSYIDPGVFRASLKHYASNNLVTFLNNQFGEAITKELIRKYHIGTSKHWPGATVFWQVDKNNKIRTGKIMLYNPDTGRRVKKPYNHINWVHSVLKMTDFNLEQCLFGEHLLKYSDAIVALVESEKTALIASVYLPSFLWLAVGSLSNLTPHKCQALKGRKVVLYPDLNAYDRWKEKVDESILFTNFCVSDLLEKHATDEDRAKGLDLADYLLRCGYNSIGRDDL